MKLTNISTRRSFLQRLGLGAGAAVLGPVAESLVNEAMGQPSQRKRTVILISGNGIHYDLLFTPPEVRAQDPKLAKAITTKDFTWPAMLKKAEKYRGRTLLVDGLTNRQQWGHSAGYAALSGITAANGASNEHGGAPGGVTIDQFIGKAKQTPFKTVLVGLGKAKVVFSSGAERPEAAVTSVAQLYRSLFGITADPRVGTLKERLLFDSLRADLRRLNGALAGPERLKLDHLLSSVEGLERRSRALVGLTCTAPAAPSGAEPSAAEDKLEALVSLATIALLCGMTDVVGISAGCGPSHGGFPSFNRAAEGAGLPMPVDWGYVGHAAHTVQGPVLTVAYDYMSGVLARVADALSAQKEGDGTAFDNSTLLLTSDNADQHHSSHERWPLVVMGGAGTIKTDGRFIRYPLRGQPGNRSLVDFYCSLAHAAGVPTDTFGMGGTEPVKGPLPEIM